jgi:hypothetical protein
LARDEHGLGGEAKYRALVEICRAHGVITPEDPYIAWPGVSRCVLAPLFVGYDYSFRPDEVSADDAVEWAAESGIVCQDELLLRPDPHSSRAAWCAARVVETAARLSALPGDCSTVLINHYPLLRSHAHLPLIPRFSIWCGTRATEDWHRRFRARVVVSGHLHWRTTRWCDGVRFEEVSLGYPRQWAAERGLDGYLKEILPGPQAESEQRWEWRHGIAGGAE